MNFAFILWDEAEAPSKSPHVAPVVDVLLALGAAEAYGRQTDADRNTIADYWTADVSGLYRVERMPNGSGKPLALIDRAIASADARPMGDGNTTPGGTIPDLALTTAALVGGLPREPYLGYWFAAVPGFAEDPDGDGKAWTHATRFGICAFPASYGESSKESYLIGESGVVWAHDLGKAAAIEAWPADPAQSGWRPISGIPGGMPIALLEGACAAFLRGVDTRFAEPSTSLRLLGRLLECTPTAVASRPPVVELLMMLWRLCDERNPEFERHDWPAVEKGALELRNTPQAVPLADRLIEWARSERGGKETGVDPSSAGS